MNLRKFCGQQVFNGEALLDGDHVVITNDEGIVQDVVPLLEAGEGVERYEGILSPGFINCHCHLELSHMKGLVPEKTGLVDFVYKVVTQRHFLPEEITAAIALGEKEMIDNGIVAVGDICNTTFTLLQKQQQQLAYFNFIEASGWLPGGAAARFIASRQTYQQFIDAKLVASLVPHAPYSVSHKMWQKLAPYFNGQTITIHNQETAFENAFFINGTGDFLRMYQLMNIDNSHYVPGGKTSLQTVFSNMAKAKSLVLVHNTFTTAGDVAFATERSKNSGQQLFWCICINANLYIEDVVPPIQLLRNNHCQIVLGTDSLASNHQLSILNEMRAIKTHFAAVGLEEMLRWATINGATALQMDDKLGSFEKGKKPGVVQLSDDLTKVQRLL